MVTRKRAKKKASKRSAGSLRQWALCKGRSGRSTEPRLLGLIKSFVCMLVVSATPGCLTPALWSWATDEDISEVTSRGVALGRTESDRDRIFVGIEGMVNLDDGDYQIDLPLKVRKDGAPDADGVLHWKPSGWIGGEFSAIEGFGFRLDEPLDLMLVPCADVEAQLSDAPMMQGTYGPRVRIGTWTGTRAPDMKRDLVRKVNRRGSPYGGVYGYDVESGPDGTRILSILARLPAGDNPRENLLGGWVELGQIDIGPGRPAPTSRKVVATVLTPISLVLEPVAVWFYIVGSMGG